MRNLSFPTVTRIAIPPLLTAASCVEGTLGVVRNRNHEPQSAGIKTATGLVTRIAIGIAIGNMTGPKRETSGMVQNGPMGTLHNTKTTTVSAAVLTSANVHMDIRVLSMTAKQSKGMGPVPVRHASHRRSHIHERQPLAASTHVTFNTFSHTS